MRKISPLGQDHVRTRQLKFQECQDINNRGPGLANSPRGLLKQSSSTHSMDNFNNTMKPHSACCFEQVATGCYLISLVLAATGVWGDFMLFVFITGHGLDHSHPFLSKLQEKTCKSC